jgi:hypothetical protein
LALTTTIGPRDAKPIPRQLPGRFMQNKKALALLLMVSAAWILAIEALERALLVGCWYLWYS